MVRSSQTRTTVPAATNNPVAAVRERRRMAVGAAASAMGTSRAVTAARARATTIGKATATMRFRMSRTERSMEASAKPSVSVPNASMVKIDFSNAIAQRTTVTTMNTLRGIGRRSLPTVIAAAPETAMSARCRRLGPGDDTKVSCAMVSRSSAAIHVTRKTTAATAVMAILRASRPILGLWESVFDAVVMASCSHKNQFPCRLNGEDLALS